MREDVEATVSLWNNVKKFQKPGIEIGYEDRDEYNEDRFLSFADRLLEWHPKAVDEVIREDEDTKISVGSPKPPQMDFEFYCIICEEELENPKPHIEIYYGESLSFLCLNCFFTLPRMEESLKENIG